MYTIFEQKSFVIVVIVCLYYRRDVWTLEILKTVAFLSLYGLVSFCIDHFLVINNNSLLLTFIIILR